MSDYEEDEKMLKQFATSPEVIGVLSRGIITGNTYFLPEQLESGLYEAVNKVLVALGAKWSRKEGGHVFDYPIKDELDSVLSTGIVTDWKKSTDFFFTPEAVAMQMIGLVPRYCNDRFTMLEPEAGQGHLLDVFWENFPNAKIKAVEINPNHCQRLREKDYDPICGDFLKVEPFPVDLVMMNPSFSDEMDHIRHAYKFLADGGQLITVASAMILRRNNKKGKEFASWFESVQGAEYQLKPGSFKEAGTGVYANLLVIDKEED